MKFFRSFLYVRRIIKLKGLLIFLSVFFYTNLSQAQDLEPGFMSAIPIGGNIGIVSYGHSRGDILLDNTLPVDDLDSKLNSIGLGYVRSFKMFNRLAKFDVILPYAFGEFNGKLEGIERTVSKNGFGDPLLRLNNNNSLKAAYTNGVFTTSGADVNTLLLAYQFLWFDKKMSLYLIHSGRFLTFMLSNPLIGSLKIDTHSFNVIKTKGMELKFYQVTD